MSAKVPCRVTWTRPTAAAAARSRWPAATATCTPWSAPCTSATNSTTQFSRPPRTGRNWTSRGRPGIPGDPARAADVVLHGVERRFDLLEDCRGDIVVSNVHLGAADGRTGRGSGRCGPRAGRPPSAVQAARAAPTGPAWPGIPVLSRCTPCTTRTIRGPGRSTSGSRRTTRWSPTSTGPYSQVAYADELHVGGRSGPGRWRLGGGRPDPDTVGRGCRARRRVRGRGGQLRGRSDRPGPPGTEARPRQRQRRRHGDGAGAPGERGGERFRLNSDGQDSGSERRCTWNVVPQRLRVIVPAGS